MRRPNGTREWLGDLYDRHAAALFRYAVMILADREAAAELTGDPLNTIASRYRYALEKLRTVL